ncbi:MULTISPECIES: nucleoside triphosphate pyrophosphatase [Arthrobacter]|uniref:Nucleoside triphosphate pyrophosphatase n=2 Tax=Arthrobacter TaxID=1663 RepID=A0ABU9KN24_9MICC|nr:nucleoside triphosphate pyrophosphatase [Arthrobacter sp. YJM1]MDP5227293.1 nucleoside triphosphate pyrophosphatase [Arthrobacter sp. YJM1]
MSPTNAAPRLILASKSPARAKLLTEAGIRFEVLVSDVDEDAVTAAAGSPTPAETAFLLAKAKSEAVAALPAARGAFILGCDSVFEFDGEAHGKPYEPDAAVERIARMSGREGVLHTGHWLIGPAPIRPGTAPDGGSGILGSGILNCAGLGEVNSATVRFGTMERQEIEAYVATGEPLHCAGSFTIDGIGGAFIESVTGDPHTVVGLSISTLRTMLADFGLSITEFWDH